ncbi:MAG: type II toxin-antitoxin system HicA family toxin [Bacteroidales bacterium]|nr:type II toxin-antitoxin system HicA family toxin [Bacteroidales bacterium]
MISIKYHKFERTLRKIGCYPIGEDGHVHSLWHSPVTNNNFMMSHHHSQEVAFGTLKAIMKRSGLVDL